MIVETLAGIGTAVSSIFGQRKGSEDARKIAQIQANAAVNIANAQAQGSVMTAESKQALYVFGALALVGAVSVFFVWRR